MEKAGELVISIEDWQGWKIIHFTGILIVNLIPAVRRRFEEVEHGAEPHVAMDLTEVTSMDSSILSMMVNLDHRLRKTGGKVVIIGPGEKISDAFFKTGIDHALPVYSSRSVFEQAALES